MAMSERGPYVPLSCPALIYQHELYLTEPGITYALDYHPRNDGQVTLFAMSRMVDGARAWTEPFTYDPMYSPTARVAREMHEANDRKAVIGIAKRLCGRVALCRGIIGTNSCWALSSEGLRIAILETAQELGYGA